MRNVLPILTAAIILLTATSGCKKNTSGTNGSNSTPLIPESTGWTRVASVANTGLYVDQNTQCRMQGYDLVVNGNNLNILYSEDKFENGMYQSQYLTATLTAGSSNIIATCLANRSDHTSIKQNASKCVDTLGC